MNIVKKVARQLQIAAAFLARAGKPAPAAPATKDVEDVFVFHAEELARIAQEENLSDLYVAIMDVKYLWDAGCDNAYIRPYLNGVAGLMSDKHPRSEEMLYHLVQLEEWIAPAQDEEEDVCDWENDPADGPDAYEGEE